jgi:hypothetical protein
MNRHQSRCFTRDYGSIPFLPVSSANSSDLLRKLKSWTYFLSSSMRMHNRKRKDFMDLKSTRDRIEELVCIAKDILGGECVYISLINNYEENHRKVSLTEKDKMEYRKIAEKLFLIPLEMNLNNTLQNLLNIIYSRSGFLRIAVIGAISSIAYIVFEFFSHLSSLVGKFYAAK